MNIQIIIQARTGSTRLPKKVLSKLGQFNCLQHVINRSMRSGRVSQVVVATTDHKDDNIVETCALQAGAVCFRGSELDVLDRYYCAAKKYSADLIVRITGDCPCTDPEVIDFVIDQHCSSGVDFTSNAACGEGLEGRGRTFPRGTDVEVITYETLSRCHLEARKGNEREHVTPYIIMHPEIFKTQSIKAPAQWEDPKLRLTLDTSEDLDLLCEVFRQLGSDFDLSDVINLVADNPWMRKINCHVPYEDPLEN